jgi:hypothetical protein
MRSEDCLKPPIRKRDGTTITPPAAGVTAVVSPP